MSLKHFLLATASIAMLLPGAAMAQTAAPAPTAPTPAADAPPAAPPAGVPADAPKPVTNPNAPVTRGEFEAMLRETLMNNPQIIMETVKQLHTMHRAETERQMKEALQRNKEAMAKDTTSPRVGNLKDADITIYEFFDYHCGYCKHMLPVITKLIESDKKVRVVFFEFPILSEDSVMAARAALAVYRLEPDKYFKFHTELLNTKGKFEEKVFADIAKKAGVDWKKVKKEMSRQEITDQLDKVRALAEDLGVRGTPAFVIGDEIVPGAIPFDDMEKLIDAIRKGESTSATDMETKSTAEPPPPREPEKADPKPAAN